jgi:PTS system ascorbate-specific IIC component
MQAIIEFLSSQIFGDAAILFGLVALLGLLLQRKPVSQVLMGTAKTVIGFLILLEGANLLTAITTPVAAWISALLNVEGVQPSMWAVLGVSMAEFGTTVGVSLLLGFVLNLILARITPYRFVNVTGHIMLVWGAFVIGVLAGFGIRGVPLMVTGTIACGLSYWLAPTLMYPALKERVTDEWSLCMPCVSGVLFGYFAGRAIGRPEEGLEDMEVPDYLAWLRDSVVNIAILSMVLWLILGLLVGRDVVQEAAGDKNWIIFLILMGARFSGGIAIILYGVRMLIAEIVPAFAGIADKLFPGALLGLDYPTVFPFSPMAVFVGFLSKLLGAIVGTLLMALLGTPVVVMPSVFMDFWDGALIGVVADRVGGRRAAIILPFIWGIVTQFGFMLMVPLLGGPLGELRLINDYPDVGWLTPIWLLTRGLTNAAGQWGAAALWVVILIVTIIVANLIGRRRAEAPAS